MKLTHENLANEWWRLNNLYKIKDKYGQAIPFRLNKVQQHLYRNLWYLLIILKARQLGSTTFIQLFILDRCLFNDNTNAGVIAHTLEDAEAFFKDKIKFAYDNLPEEIKLANPARNDSARELTFANGSRIRVGTSMRSGTLQYLHVSEFGKICAKYPDKAKEVITGSLNTVAPGNFVAIESTAEGRQGEFYDMCMAAENMHKMGQKLTKMDYKFFFFGWYWDPAYELHLDRHEPMPDNFRTYFHELEEEHDIQLTLPQKHWYMSMSKTQGKDMKQEYPSVSAEAFEKKLEGAIFGEAVQDARHSGRVCEVPFEIAIPVNTFWDLGHNDTNSIWFHQRVGPWDHFINYYEHRQVDITHYLEVLDEMEKGLRYKWGTMYLPHDGKTKHIEALAGSVKDIMQRHGFRVKVTNRPTTKNVSIAATRLQFPHCRFDKEKCDIGLSMLENYQWSWDKTHMVYRNTPLHNTASNGADAFQTYGHGYSGERQEYLAQASLLDKDRHRTYRSAKRGVRRTRPNYDHII